MSDNQLTLHDRIEDIFESINLIQVIRGGSDDHFFSLISC